MGMNLQAELEPLLTTLWNAADTKYMGHAFEDPTNPGEIAKAEEGRAHLHSDLTGLLDRFRGYYSLDGHDLDLIAEQFADPSDDLQTPTGSSVYCSIGRAAEDVNDVGKLIHFEQWAGPPDSEQWAGDAATAFHNNFLEPFKKTALVHAVTARDLAVGAKALAAAVEHAKACVVWVCKDAISRLGGGDAPGRLPGADGPDFRETAAFTAICADAVATFIALAAPEIELLSVALAATGVTGGLLAEWKKEGSEHERPIGVGGSESASEILYLTWTALDNLDYNLSEFDEKAAKGLEADLAPSGPLGSPYAQIENPHLDPSAFKRSTIGKPDFAVPDAKNSLITSIVRLYYAGYRTLPDAAKQYEYGRKTCADAHIDGAQKQFPQASAKFNELAERLGHLMEAVHDDLADSGAAIVTAANLYDATDAHAAAAIKRFIAEIPSIDNFAANSDWDPPSFLAP
jgi:hypothetical protein